MGAACAAGDARPGRARRRAAADREPGRRPEPRRPRPAARPRASRGTTSPRWSLAAALGCEVADAEMRCEAFAHAQRFLRVAGRVEWPDRSVSRRYAFTHELYRQVVYAEIPEGRCMRLHQRIGQALEAAYGARPTEIAPQLAIHFERGRDGARALHYLTAAGGRRAPALRQSRGDRLPRSRTCPGGAAAGRRTSGAAGSSSCGCRSGPH